MDGLGGDSGEESDLLPLSQPDATYELSLTASERPIAVETAAPSQSPGLPYELPLSDDDALGDEELVATGNAIAASARLGSISTALAPDREAAFSLVAPPQSRGRGAGRGGRQRGRPRTDCALIPSSLAPRENIPVSSAQSASLAVAAPSSSDALLVRTAWAGAVDADTRRLLFGSEREGSVSQRPLLVGGFSEGVSFAEYAIVARDAGLGKAGNTVKGAEIERAALLFVTGDKMRTSDNETAAQQVGIPPRLAGTTLRRFGECDRRDGLGPPRQHIQSHCQECAA